MDWDLVLISQDIPATLCCGVQGWTLAVEPEDFVKASAAIHQYERENQGWGWRQELGDSGLVFHWGMLIWCGLIPIPFMLETWHNLPLRQLGMVDAQAVWQGAWWRLFTAVTLHSDAAHLASNTSIGLVLLGLVMARFGAGWGALTAYFCGVAGNLFGLAMRSGAHRSLGASGMVMGALGMLSVLSLVYLRLASHTRPGTGTDRDKITTDQSPGLAPLLQPIPLPLFRTRFWRKSLAGLFAGICLFMLLGLNPESDVLAHLGGYLSGLVMGVFLLNLPSRWLASAWTNALALLLLAWAVLGPWWLAFH